MTAEARFSFPAEWEPHRAVWVGWPALAGGTHRVLCELVAALARRLPVRIVTDHGHDSEVRSGLRDHATDLDRVEFLIRSPAPFIRDPGPRFLVRGEDRAIAEFAWNGYGYPRELLDLPGVGSSMGRPGLGRWAAERLGLPVVDSPIVAEGGALEVSDDVILSYASTALLRNAGRALEEIEAEYLRLYGKRKVVWLSECPLSDRVCAGPKIANYFGWGANGHIDEYVRFAGNSTVLVAQIEPDDAKRDPLSEADDQILRSNLAEIRDATDANGSPFDIVTMPVPRLSDFVRTERLTGAHRRWDRHGAWFRDVSVGDEVCYVPAVSYLNFFVTNDTVLVPAYWTDRLPARVRERDEQAREILAAAFPDREMVPINPLELNFNGGGMHCATQQEPA